MDDQLHDEFAAARRSWGMWDSAESIDDLRRLLHDARRRSDLHDHRKISVGKKMTLFIRFFHCAATSSSSPTRPTDASMD